MTGGVGPVDGAGAGPEVVVFGAVVVVEVELGDAGFQELKGFVDGDVLFGGDEVGVTYVEADAYAVEVTYVKDFEDVFGGGDFVLQVFDEDADAEGVGEGFEVLDGGEGVFEGPGVPGVVFVTEVEDTGGDGDLFGGFEGALDLIHGGDAVGFVCVDEVEVGGDVAGPLGVAVGEDFGAIAEEEGLMECGADVVVAEPEGDVADGGAVGVVEVVAGGEELDSRGAGVAEGVEQAGVQAMLEEDVGGDCGLHQLLRYSRGRFQGVSARIGTRKRGDGMRFLMRMVWLGCVGLGSGVGWGQTAPATVPPPPAAAPAPVDTAKQMAAMEKKLADWPQLDRYRADNAALGPVPEGEQRVVFYGDSITDGWGRRDGTGAFFPGKAYVNRGISGQTTPQMVVRFRQDVINLHPAAVVILAGTNDVAGNTGPMTPEMTEDNFRSMIDLAKANGIRVIVASITPAADYPWRPGLAPAAKIRALNNWLQGYCVTHSVTYLDYYSALAGEDGGMKAGLSFDGVHPNAAGYAIMGPLAQAAIDKVLGK